MPRPSSGRYFLQGMERHPKICSRNQLLELRQSASAAAKTVVHCHGCFDIVHPGHIQYLQFARSLGDVLIVTVSADVQVNKGINRPLIPDDLRAASLAALECVDAVYVNPHPTAIEILSELKPDIYVKGREYETNRDPRFLAEKDEVTRQGGRVVFSSGDVIYSSSELIGSLQSSGPFNDEKVRRFRQQYDLDDARLSQLVLNCRGKRILVVGDYISDVYHFCDAGEIAGEGPMMSVRTRRCQQYDGGAAIIARHLAGLGAKVTLITSLAKTSESEQVIDRLTAEGISVRSVYQRRQLATKTRYLVDHAKLFKVDEGAVTPLDSRSVEIVSAIIAETTANADGIIFADFGYGTITNPLLDRVLKPVRAAVPIVTADVSGPQRTLLRFADADLLCPTEREVRQTLNNFSSGLNAVVYELLERTRAQSAMITLGRQGLCLFDQRKDSADAAESWDRKLRTSYLPALSRHAVDPLGCGDALLATASLAMAAGASRQSAAFLGSIAAAVEAQQIGNVPVTADQLLSQLHGSSERMPMRLAS